MAKTKGQKAVERENARLVREKKKQIEQANRMLIPVPKATANSLRIVSFDPTGVFRFADGRWVKCYRIVGTEDISSLGEVIGALHSEVKLTKKLGLSNTQSFLTLTVEDQIYDEVRTNFSEDEATLRGHINLIPLSVDEVMNIISEGRCNFNYASMVRGKKDWKEECFPVIEAENSYFKMGESYGESCFVMQFPEHVNADIIMQLAGFGCEIYLSINLRGIDELDMVDYNRALEKRYNRRLTEESSSFMNQSMQLVFLCDSDDARAIIEKTILTLFSKAGYVISPAIGYQKAAVESALSLGIVNRKYMRNISTEAVNEFLGKEELWL